MAGIGFALRSLWRKDTLWSIFESQLHGIIAVAGPWFFTILSMALPALLFHDHDTRSIGNQFVTLLLYVFASSLVLTAPIVIVLTRQVSDCLYERREAEVAGTILAAASLAFVLSLPVAIIGWQHIDVPRETRVLLLLCDALVTLNWIVSPLLSTVRQFRLLTLAYAAGTAVFALYLRGRSAPEVPDFLTGFLLGMVATDVLVCGLVWHTFPGRTWHADGLRTALGKYWDLALAGLLQGLGVWVDKWLMWRAPEHVNLPGGLVAYPLYDTATFIAYATTIPALALFIIQAETSFHESCRHLYRSIQTHGDRATLEHARLETQKTFRDASRHVGLLQLTLTLFVLTMPTVLLDLFKLPASGVFMFRFCALGAAFQSGVLMLTIVLHYFDSRRTVLQINAAFFVLNAVLTWIGLKLGFAFYGFGYFLAAISVFSLAYFLVERTFRDLLYLAFVQQNAAVANAPFGAHSTTTWFAASISPGPLQRKKS